MSIGVWERFVGLVTNPTQTIREMNEEPFGNARNYYFGLLGLILLPIILLLIGAVLIMSAVDGASGAANTTIGALVIIVVLIVTIAVAIALMSVCLHIAVLICGGNGSFTQTVKAYLNSLTPVPVLYVGALVALVLALVLPPLGILLFYLLAAIVSAWIVALLIVGIQEYHHLTTFRSVAAYFIMQGIITAVIASIMLILVIIVGVTLGPYLSDPSMYQGLY